MQVPQGPRQPPSLIRHPHSPLRHPDPEKPQNDPIPMANNSRGSRGNRTLDQNQGNNIVERPHSNQNQGNNIAERPHSSYRILMHPVQPRQLDMPSPRMGNNGPRPLPRRNHKARTNTYREASVGHSQSASSNSGCRGKYPHREPDLREQLNQNRGLKAYQPDLRDRLNEQRDQPRPLGYPPTMLAMPVIPSNDTMAVTYAQLAAQVRSLQDNQE